jgi:hypothetical protein
MISDLDIWRAANLLIRQHGENAELEACRLADPMLDRGHRDGKEVAVRFLRVDDTELIVSIPREALAQVVELALAERDRQPN